MIVSSSLSIAVATDFYGKPRREMVHNAEFSSQNMICDASHRQKILPSSFRHVQQLQFGQIYRSVQSQKLLHRNESEIVLGILRPEMAVFHHCRSMLDIRDSWKVPDNSSLQTFQSRIPVNLDEFAASDWEIRWMLFLGNVASG